MDAPQLTATRHSFKFRTAGRGRKGSQRFSWTAAKDLFRKHLDRRMCMAGTLASARILKLFGRQRGKLPLQILISVALDSCGGNSPVANAGRLKNFVASCSISRRD
jgi:hypothetical protein